MAVGVNAGDEVHKGGPPQSTHRPQRPHPTQRGDRTSVLTALREPAEALSGEGPLLGVYGPVRTACEP